MRPHPLGPMVRFGHAPIGDLFNLAVAQEHILRFGMQAHRGDKFAAITHDAVNTRLTADEPKRVPK